MTVLIAAWLLLTATLGTLLLLVCAGQRLATAVRAQRARHAARLATVEAAWSTAPETPSPTRPLVRAG